MAVGRRARAWLKDPWPAAYAASLLLFAATLFVAHSLRSYLSDDVAVQTMVGQWQRGYHETTHLGVDSFILKIPLYALIDLLLPNGRGALLVTALVLNLTGFALFVASVRYFATKFGIDRPSLFVWPLLWVAGLGVTLADTLINPNLRNLEIGLAFLLMMLVAKVWDRELNPSPAWILLAVPLLGLFLYNDPYFLFLAVIPLIGLLAAFLVLRPFDRRTAALAAVLLGGIVAFKATDSFFRLFDLRAAQTRTTLADLNGIRRHLEFLVDGGLQLFEADVISNGLSLRPGPVLNLAVLACVLLYPVALWRRRVSLREEPWKWFFGLYALLVPAVYVFSDQAGDLASARYLVLLPFLFVLVIGLGLDALTGPRLRTGALALVATALAANLAGTVDDYLDRPGGPNRLNARIVDVARQNGLTKGYADYWQSNINTYLSHDRIDFIQVQCERSRLVPHRWLTDDGVYAKPATRTFYLWEGEGIGSGCPYDELIQQFGEPAEQLPVVDGVRLLVYDYDLLGRM